MGGTGKTPLTLMLASYFISTGKKVCILSRGYKGKIGLDTNIISDGKNILLTPPLAADEPYMLANSLKEAIVITGKDRIKSYNYAKKLFSPDIFILDDGFQHKKMKRDINILLLDHSNPISTGLPFPFGYLREFPTSIKRADIIIFTRATSKQIPAKVKSYIKNKHIFFSHIETDGIFNNNYKKIDLNDKLSFFAFSGIAKNKQFVQTLINLNIKIKGTKFFKDHHIYTKSDERSLLKSLKDSKADLFITTEKDFFKLSSNMKEITTFLKIRIKLDDTQKFFKLI
jgi:tetraacyldisaccharide 4'-kinase